MLDPLRPTSAANPAVERSANVAGVGNDSKVSPGASRKYRLSASPIPRLLISSRAVRGFGQGMMLADFALYLKAVGWDAAAIGMVLGLGALGEIGACIFVGLAGDRGTRKRLLILGELLTFGASCLAAYSASTVALAAAALMGGLGQRSNGSPGPFSPSEQSLFANSSPAFRWGEVLSLNSAMGFAGLGGGALAAGLLIGPEAGSGHARIFRPLFIFSAFLSAANILLLSQISEPRPERRSAAITARDHPSARQRESRSLRLLVLVNLLNGTAIGMADLLAPYWFARQFQVRPFSISILMATVFFLTAMMACGMALLIARVGHLKLLLQSQFVSAAFLLLLPLISVYWLAFIVLAVRYSLTRSPAGVRQTLTNDLVRRQNIALATSLNVSSLQIGQLFAPYFAGLLLDRGQALAPFFIAGSCQAAAVALYKRCFREPCLNTESGAI